MESVKLGSKSFSYDIGTIVEHITEEISVIVTEVRQDNSFHGVVIYSKSDYYKEGCLIKGFAKDEFKFSSNVYEIQNKQ